MRVKSIFILFLLSFGLYCRDGAAQDTLVFKDDPVAEMLDSLARLKYFEKGYVKPSFSKSSKYNFAPDSVPRYDDFIYESRLAKLDAQTPFDLQYNDVVKAYIELYAVRKRELVSRIMGLTQLYFPLFEDILDRYKLPLELKYLAIVESALNPNAKSRAGAMGLWQFMYPTGKLYGLKVTSYIDDRCDPYKSTIAACEYIQFLYDLFGDWQMVLAAYNGGPGTVNKAIRRSGGKRTYWEIRPYLPKETQGYVPAFIAVNYVMNHTAEHNIYSHIPKRTFFQVDTVLVKQQISFDQISSVLNIPLDEVQFLNPAYKRSVIPGDGYSVLCLPSSKIGNFITNETAIYNYLKKDTLSSQAILASQETMKIHTVKRGEKLSLIASRYKCSMADIKMWNNLRSSSVKPGQKLTVYINKSASPSTATAVAVKAAASNAPEGVAKTAAASKYKLYTIQRGDTLWDIAKTHGVTVDEIKKWNNLGKSYTLIPGKKLKVGYSG